MLPEPEISAVLDERPIGKDSSHNQPGKRRKVNWAVLVTFAMLVTGVTGVALVLVPNLRDGSVAANTGGVLGFDQEMIRIADQLQCPICQGQSVAFSNSPLADEMRRLILEKLQMGENEAQITQYFVDRYGVSILREPSWQGLNLWLWMTPAIGMGLGVTGLIWALRRMSSTRQKEISPNAPHPLEPTLDPEVHELVVQYDREFLA